MASEWTPEAENYYKLLTTGGMLNSTHPVAKAIEVKKEALGSGGQAAAFVGHLIWKELPEAGYASLWISKRAHEILGRNPLKKPEYMQAYKQATQECKEKSSNRIAEEVKAFFKENHLLPDQEVAVRISYLDSEIDYRDPRLAYMVGLYHDNLVYHIAHGETRGKLPFLLMERMDDSLDPKETKERSLRYHLHIMKSTARAADEIKARSIVHRDIKPDNIFYRKNGTFPEIKIADFGVMNPIELEKTRRKTRTGTCIGTPYYLSPEQVLDAAHAPWQTDQLALGATWYHLLTGLNPLGIEESKRKPELFEILSEARNRDQVRLKSVAGEKNIQLEGIERILARTLQANHEQRYKNYESLLQDIARVEKGKLPLNSSPDMVPTAFKPGEYSNYFANRSKRIFWRTVMAAGGISAIVAAAYKLGYTAPIVEWITNAVSKIGG
jgi:serine/threonine protein kinase